MSDSSSVSGLVDVVRHNQIKFAFFNIESDKKQVVLIVAAIHSFKMKKFNGNNKNIYRKKRSV